MKLVVVTGTRPNFVKQYAFGRACAQCGVESVVVHTGQHYDRNMSETFFTELGMPQPDFVNDLINSTPARELSDIMTFIEGVLYQERPDCTVVYGDVTSTLAASLASARCGIPVAHVEAGARGQYRYNPEEINRRVTETLADTLFAHIGDARQALLDSGFSEDNIFMPGDIMKDSLLLAMRDHGITLGNKGYVVATVHRAENTDNPERLAGIVDGLLASKREIRFPVHPRTERSLKRYGLWEKLEESDFVTLLPPQSYLNNIRLLAKSDRVASDSGGVRREAYILRKPVISLIDMVWVPAMAEAGWKYVASCDSERIVEGLNAFSPPEEHPPIFGEGDAAVKIVETLKERYGTSERSDSLCLTGINNTNSLASKAVGRFSAELPLSTRLTSKLKRVAIVTPCYNEQDSLPTYFYKMDHLKQVVDRNRFKLSFVLVDDCSTDATLAMLEGHLGERRDVRIVQSETNQGFGGALKAGIAQAEGDYVLTVDADTNYDMLDAPVLLDALDEGVDLVTGSPFMNGGRWNYPAHRFVMSRGVVMLYRAVLREKARNIKTFTCGFRAYRRAALEEVIPEADDFLATAEILVRSLLRGMTVAEVPVVNYDRKFGDSKLKTVRMIRRHLGFLARLAVNGVH